MENAQLINLSRLSALSRQMNIVANNLANVNTTGFKSEELLFGEFIEPEASADEFKFVDRDLSFVLDDLSVGNFGTGPVSSTGNQLDVAIQGDGFFAIQTAAGERYTRDGSFTLDPTGQLTTHQGDAVLGEGGPIIVNPEETNITITADGIIAGAEGEIGRLRVVQFEDTQQLTRIGNNLFSSENQLPAPAQNARLQQFALEGANVDAVVEISQLIQVQRAYNGVANMMREQNDLRETAIQRLGRVQVNS